jgi:hypothetical protein
MSKNALPITVTVWGCLSFNFLPDLRQIRERALDMRTHQILLEESTGAELSRRAKAEHDQRLWLGDQITAMTTVFNPYLGFANVRLKVYHRSSFFAEPLTAGRHWIDRIESPRRVKAVYIHRLLIRGTGIRTCDSQPTR